MQLPCHFSGKEKSVSSVFHRFFRPKHSHDFTLQARFYTFITKNKTQSQPNDFSSGWKNIFFLRMAYRPVPQIRPKTSWRPFKIVPYRLVFSLIAPLLPSKKGSRHVRQIPLPAFTLHCSIRPTRPPYFLFANKNITIPTKSHPTNVRDSFISGHALQRAQITDSHKPWIDFLTNWQIHRLTLSRQSSMPAHRSFAPWLCRTRVASHPCRSCCLLYTSPSPRD